MKYIVTVDNKKYEVELHEDSNCSSKSSSKSNGIKESLKAPMPGTILDIKISSGDVVKRGDILFILEAMKMENEITSPKDGVIKDINITKGASVSTNDVLATIE